MPLPGDDMPEQIDAWLVRPDNPPQRVADKRRRAMRLSALFEEFSQFQRVEKEAAPRSIETYRWCFGDFEQFARNEVGGTVLIKPLHRRVVPRVSVRPERSRTRDEHDPPAVSDARQLREMGGTPRAAR